MLFVVLGGMWVLNWLAVVLLTGALGLRRRRWGTPGGGWALASAALHVVAAVGIVLWALAGTFLGGSLSGGGVILVTAIIVTLLATWVAAHVMLVRALWLAWSAVDLAVASRAAHPADGNPAEAPAVGAAP
ncbi:hypothetical protein [Alienimonas californiensis]|uniref:hypothetical protein n=1 Tax=Alienimonas californiensis TaxID=2527989 RepID=UPI00119CD328|nr:hypothetical protein [Alienimonas californiensis]